MSSPNNNTDNQQNPTADQFVQSHFPGGTGTHFNAPSGTHAQQHNLHGLEAPLNQSNTVDLEQDARQLESELEHNYPHDSVTATTHHHPTRPDQFSQNQGKNHAGGPFSTHSDSHHTHSTAHNTYASPPHSSHSHQTHHTQQPHQASNLPLSAHTSTSSHTDPDSNRHQTIGGQDTTLDRKAHDLPQGAPFDSSRSYDINGNEVPSTHDHHPHHNKPTSDTEGYSKPSMSDKIVGMAEKVQGKITGNPALVERGEERRQGFSAQN